MVFRKVVAKDAEYSDNHFHLISDAGRANKYGHLVVNNQILLGNLFQFENNPVLPSC